MTVGAAALPMYDWPEVKAATDQLWASIRDRLRAAGIAAPEALAREPGPVPGPADSDLVLSQVCGLPLVGDFAGRVTVIGTPDYGVPGCAPGWYRSAVVVRGDDPRAGLPAFRGARAAVSGFDSQSGWGSLLHHAAPLAEGGTFFGSVSVSGAHAVSIEDVASGNADLAAIDFVSWRFAQRYLPEARRLRVLLLTDPTPGLPYITALGRDVERCRLAVRAAIAGLDADTRAKLDIGGFAPLGLSDYQIIARRFSAAAAALPRHFA